MGQAGFVIHSERGGAAREGASTWLSTNGDEDGVLRMNRHLPPRRRPGPSWGTVLTAGARRYCDLSNWAPAFAGVEA
jgi:hypothetical protein